MGGVDVGSVFAGYRIEDVAGRGGMGVVYRARQLRPERIVALKVISPELAEDPDFRVRFERESEVAAQIEHPNVIPVYAVDEAEGFLFIVMRFVDGTDLRQLIRAGLTPARAARIVAQVGAALDAAHAAGLVHRDIKPGNVLVASAGGEDHAYLTDFGLAKRTSAEEGPTRTGQFVGTVDYMAPEQIRGGRVDARTDVYALACVLYQALTGHVPYPRDSDVSKIFAHLNEPPPELDTDVPPGFADVIRRGMAKSSDDRYQSTGDLGRAAVAALSGGGPVVSGERSVAVGAAAPGPDSEATLPPGADPEATFVGGEETPLPGTAAGSGTPTRGAKTAAGATEVGERRRSPWVWVAAAAAVVVVVVVLVAGGGGGGKAKKPAVPAGQVVGQAIPVGRSPEGIAAGHGLLWVANSGEGTVSRLDPGTGKTVGAPIRVGREPFALAVGDKDVWVADARGASVVRIDARTGRVVGRTHVGAGPASVAIGSGAVWVPLFVANQVVKLDERTGKVIARTRLPAQAGGAGPADVAIGSGAVWVVNLHAGTVVRLNPDTGQPVGAPLPAGRRPSNIAVSQDRLWVTNIDDDTVTRLSFNGKFDGAPVDVPRQPDDVLVDGSTVWVASGDADQVTRLDEATGKRIGRPLNVDSGPSSLAKAAGKIWVANVKGDTVNRISPTG